MDITIKRMKMLDKDKLETILMSIQFAGSELGSGNSASLEKYVSYGKTDSVKPKSFAEQYLDSPIHTEDQDLLEAAAKEMQMESDLSGDWYPTDNEYQDGR